MKPTLQLISIFVIALVYFIGYSMVPDSVADALHLKQIGQPSIAVAGEATSGQAGEVKGRVSAGGRLGRTGLVES